MSGRSAGLSLSPNPRYCGAASLVVPVAGGWTAGQIGDRQIRGDSIPEAIHTILAADSEMSWRVAVCDPMASAIAIGTVGPFGTEGPVIMTAGAHRLPRWPSGVPLLPRAAHAASRGGGRGDARYV